MAQISVRMTLERVTKGALRYQEIDERRRPMVMSNPITVIGTLYLRKNGLNNQGIENTTDIVVTVKTVD